jgi:hypothetical protein
VAFDLGTDDRVRVRPGAQDILKLVEGDRTSQTVLRMHLRRQGEPVQ